MILKLGDSITIENVTYLIFFDRQTKPFVRLNTNKISYLKDYTVTFSNSKIFGVKKLSKDLKKFKASVTKDKETLSYVVFAESIAAAITKVAFAYAKAKGVPVALAQSIIKNLNNNFQIEETI